MYALTRAVKARAGFLSRMSRCLSSASNEDYLPSAYEQTVGNTRLVRLKHASEVSGCDIFGTVEYENPGGSIKVRATCRLILMVDEFFLLPVFPTILPLSLVVHH